MGAMVRLWIREHRLFLIGAVLVAVALVVVFLTFPIEVSTAIAALALVPAVVRGADFDLSDGAK